MPSVSVSVVTTTFRREDLLRRCAESVLGQPADVALEHIVVNDGGAPLAPAPWMQDPRVRVLDTPRVERCAARNAGASVARGEWLYFLDDDDYALPGAFPALLAAAPPGRPALLSGAYQVYNVTTRELEDISPQHHGDVFPLLLAGEAFPTHAVWVRRDAFLAVGGFDPDMIFAEDVDLFRRVALLGDLARTDHLVAVARIHHPATTTTDPDLRRVRWWQSMEKCLAVEATWPRVLTATRHSPYWRGRCAREYWASAARNLRARRPGLALRRALEAAGLSRRHPLLPAFWRGLQRRRGFLPPLTGAADGPAAAGAKKRPVAV